MGKGLNVSGTLSKFFSLGINKTSKSSDTVDSMDADFEDSHQQPESPAPTYPEETTSPKAFLSAMTGGLISASPGSRSPSLGRKEGGSIFGSLLRKGRKGSRSGSRQSSKERSHEDIAVPAVGSEEGRTSSRTGSVDNEGAV